ncbi:hypothetical protein ACQ4PT_010623 [Festuca glaucescens]
MRRGLPRFKKGFYFVTQDIKATVEDSQMDAEAFESLTNVWVRAFGIPKWAKKERVARQLAFLVGEPLMVDKASLSKPSWVRIKVACRNPGFINGVNNVYINGKGYHISGARKENLQEEEKENDQDAADNYNEDTDQVYKSEVPENPDAVMDDDSNDNIEGWERIERYAADGSFDADSGDVQVSLGGPDMAVLSRLVTSFPSSPIIDLPVDNDVGNAGDDWAMVPCHNAKKQKVIKPPVVATRASKRIQKDAKEQAEAVLVENKDRISKERKARSVVEGGESIGLSSFTDLDGDSVIPVVGDQSNNDKFDHHGDPGWRPLVAAKRRAETKVIISRIDSKLREIGQAFLVIVLGLADGHLV